VLASKLYTVVLYYPFLSVCQRHVSGLVSQKKEKDMCLDLASQSPRYPPFLQLPRHAPTLDNPVHIFAGSPCRFPAPVTHRFPGCLAMRGRPALLQYRREQADEEKKLPEKTVGHGSTARIHRRCPLQGDSELSVCITLAAANT
jgi:hypothetical protein